MASRNYRPGEVGSRLQVTGHADWEGGVARGRHLWDRMVSANKAAHLSTMTGSSRERRVDGIRRELPRRAYNSQPGEHVPSLVRADCTAHRA